MSKILQGKIVANKMQNTVVVEVTRRFPHPLYRKLLKRSKKYKVETNGAKVEIGATVMIIETRPKARGKHFRLLTGTKPEAETRVKKTAGKKGKAEA